MKKLLVAVLLFSSATLQAQQPAGSGNDYKVKHITAEKIGTVDPKITATDWWVSVQNLEAPFPAGNSMREKLREKKEFQSARFPRKNSNTITRNSRAPEPIPGTMFEGNLYNGSVPNDNDLAVSDDGYLISVSNTAIYGYDLVNDTLILNKSLSGFSQPLNLSTLNPRYDPKVVYDYYAQRFIVVFLYGTTYQTSKIIVAFSTTTNPADPWNFYALPGNPLSNNTWSDYPVIGISQFDLFIGINTFFNGSVNNSGFYESCFWQVDLHNGYADSATLNTAYYYDILAPADTLFNITPVHKGGENNNSDMFLLSNENLAPESDSFYVLHISDKLSSGNATLQTQLVRSDRNYYLPVDANQPSGHTLDANDSRIYGAFQVGDRIQFVQGTLDTASGNDAIYHGFIEDIYGTPVITSQLIADTILDYGYPNIAWTGIYPNEARSIIAFNHTGAATNPGFSAIYFDDDSTYSNRITLKNGTTYVNVLSGIYERWGDYTGIQRRYVESCKVWAAGTWGKLNGANRINGTWIAEIASDDTCQNNPSISIPELQNESSVNVYPNPVSDFITFDFELPVEETISIDILSVDGKTVETIYRQNTRKGKNRLTFSVLPLPAGVYVVRFYGEDGFYSSRKVVKNRNDE